ncbi:MAG: hypothetical protein NVV83_04765 [Afipia sp.]|nr:hypothetical protein [Afipia sp.]
MLFRPDRPEHLAWLAEQVRAAHRASTDLVSAIASEVSHDGANGSAPVSINIERLIAAGAWTDTALALITRELPQWKLRRLAYDDGEWHCVLSPQRELPEWLDDGTETRHENLSLALFLGLVEAARRQPVRTSTPTTPRIRITQLDAICCDNFS